MRVLIWYKGWGKEYRFLLFVMRSGDPNDCLAEICYFLIEYILFFTNGIIWSRNIRINKTQRMQCKTRTLDYVYNIPPFPSKYINLPHSLQNLNLDYTDSRYPKYQLPP